MNNMCVVVGGVEGCWEGGVDLSRVNFLRPGRKELLSGCGMEDRCVPKFN
jgi:hypothetical protein